MAYKLQLSEKNQEALGDIVRLLFIVGLLLMLGVMACSLPPEKALKAPLRGPLEDAGVSLVPGTGNTWTNGTYTWAGNPFCAQEGFLLSPSSPAIDNGALIPGFHCPAAGPGDGTCKEWYGKAPDIGACEYVGTPPTPLVCDVGDDLFRGCYYDGMNFDRLVKVQDDPAIDFDWVVGGPITTDNFSIKWEGDFTFLTGTYDFTATVDDGVRIYVDGNLLLESWIDQPATTYTAALALSVGTHRVRVEYYENQGEASIKASWARRPNPTAPKQPTGLAVH